MRYAYLRQDDAGHWYLIPQELLSRYRELTDKTVSSSNYEEMESVFDAINTEFGKHRLSGGVEDLKIEID